MKRKTGRPAPAASSAGRAKVVLLRTWWRQLALRLMRMLDARVEGLRRRLAPPELVAFKDATASWLASALCVASHVRLSERVGSQGTELAELARQLALPEAALERFLKVLQAHGYFSIADGVVRHTTLSRALEHGQAGAMVAMLGQDWYRHGFHPENVVGGWRQGVSGHQFARGKPLFDELSGSPEASQLFQTAMDEITRFCEPFLVTQIPIEPGSRLLDVGGGAGRLARALAQLHLDSEFVVLDRSPHPTTGDPPNFKRRVGDFFESVPPGFDHLLLKSVLHDWNDPAALRLLENCRQAVEKGARLTLLECLLSESGSASEVFAFDWNVWVTLDGAERTLQEYDILLERTGWRREGVRHGATPYSAITARAV